MTKKYPKHYSWKHTEKYIMLFLFKIRRDSLTAILKLITHLGDGWLWFGVCILFLLINLIAGLALTASILISILLQYILKRAFNRHRPFIKHDEIENLTIPPDHFSFPSGHTSAAFSITFVFWYFYPLIFIPILVIAVLIGFSRIYLGMHYPSDVFAGVVIGFISARIGILLVLLLNI